MRPKKLKRTYEQPLIATARLELLLDVNHPIYRLAGQIDWGGLESHFGKLYDAEKGRPGIPVRLMAGLLLLQHTFKLSDEEVVARWIENPYLIIGLTQPDRIEFPACGPGNPCEGNAHEARRAPFR